MTRTLFLNELGTSAGMVENMLKYIYVMIENEVLKEECLEYFEKYAIPAFIVKPTLEDLTENYSDSLIVCDCDSGTPMYFQENFPENGVWAALLGVGEHYVGNAKYVLESFAEVEHDYFEMVYRRYHGIPTNILETSRLIVREMSTGDLPQLYRLYESVPDFVEPLYEYEKELEFTKKYIQNMYGFFGYGLWLVFLKETGELIGRMGLENRVIDGVTEVELGYLVSNRHRRKGYAYECCSAILDYAFHRLGINTVFLCSDIKNIPSRHLGKKLGFELYADNMENNLIISCRKHI